MSEVNKRMLQCLVRKENKDSNKWNTLFRIIRQTKWLEPHVVDEISIVRIRIGRRNKLNVRVTTEDKLGSCNPKHLMVLSKRFVLTSFILLNTSKATNPLSNYHSFISSILINPIHFK